MQVTDNETYEKAKSVPIRDVLAYYEVPIHKDKINCLVHDEKTPSAHIYEDANFIKCFGCHAVYYGINIVMQMEQMGFEEALNFLGNNFQVGTYVARPKKDLTLYFDINKKIRTLILEGGDVNIIKRYAQIIDMFNTQPGGKIMSLMLAIAKCRVGDKK